MSDIKCVKCGEPWDSYGVNHGDMLPWESKLFKAGAGCPSCEGVSNGWTPTSVFDIDNGDEDPMDRIVAHENVTAKWTRPEDPKHWECDGCGVQVRTDLDTNELVLLLSLGFGRSLQQVRIRETRDAGERAGPHVRPRHGGLRALSRILREVQRSLVT